MTDGKKHIISFQKKWQQALYLEAFLYGLGVFCLCFVLTQLLFISIGLSVLVVLGFLLFRAPWKKNADQVAQHIDTTYKEASYSAHLFLSEDDSLSPLAQLQRQRVLPELKKVLLTAKPPHQLKWAVITLLCMIGVAFMLYQLQWIPNYTKTLHNTATQPLTFVTPNNSKIDKNIPEVTHQKITVYPPSYTQLPAQIAEDANIRALRGATIKWTFSFSDTVAAVQLNMADKTYPLSYKNSNYTIQLPVAHSGLYHISYSDVDSITYTSDLYAIEVLEDQSPTIEITGIPQYASFDYGDNKIIPLNAKVEDDYGIKDAYIIATVSKGSGESVKFREEKLRFTTPIRANAKESVLSRKIDLDALKMDIGDELYFYIEALDAKTPNANIGRSETYFAVIKDTVTDDFAVEGNLGVDVIPDYFRSQRQLIIDTEKLIKKRNTITPALFKKESNELGFDQKMLRLKYGQFMGDESAMETTGETHEEDHESVEEEHSEENPLAGYTHDHDGANESHLVPEKEEEEKSDPLHDYLHNHEDPEASTLFEESLKTKLRKALNIMWDAELYLRLYEPEKSLPHQYKALRLIQDIKNSARIYVHRIGFDPPPIKEDKRLSGDIKAVKTTNNNTSFDTTNPFAAVEKAIRRLDELSQQSAYSKDDMAIFKEAGNEVAALAVDNPLPYLDALNTLKILSEQRNTEYIEAKKILLKVLPKKVELPGIHTSEINDINTLFLQQLSTYDQ